MFCKIGNLIQRSRFKLFCIYLSISLLALYSDLFGYFDAVFATLFFLSAFALLVIGCISKRFRLIPHAFVLIFISIMLFLAGYGANYIVGKRANEIIYAIDAYKEKYDRYPSTLIELAPEFIDYEKLPERGKLVFGARFSYLDNVNSKTPILFYSRYPFRQSVFFDFEKNSKNIMYD